MIKAVAAYLRKLCWTPITVSGELLYVESNGVVSLRLRVDGRKLLDIPRTVNREEMDELIEDGAYEVLRKVGPHLYHSFEGKRYQMRGQLEKAADEFKKAVQHDDKFALAYFNWGLVLAIQDRKMEAIELYEKAYSIE